MQKAAYLTPPFTFTVALPVFVRMALNGTSIGTFAVVEGVPVALKSGRNTDPPFIGVWPEPAVVEMSTPPRRSEPRRVMNFEPRGLGMSMGDGGGSDQSIAEVGAPYHRAAMFVAVVV